MDFISTHTRGFEALRADLDATRWEDIEANSGLTRADLEQRGGGVCALERDDRQLRNGDDAACPRHRQRAADREPAAAAGNIGKPGAGICPLRGHSNVQGDRSVGITEKPYPAMLNRIEATFGFKPPTQPWARCGGRDGGDHRRSLEGAHLPRRRIWRSRCRMPNDPRRRFVSLELSVHIGTRLNRSHLLVGKHAFLLPCLGRTERDAQATGEQSVTVEDSMSMVHASRGRLMPASPQSACRARNHRGNRAGDAASQPRAVDGADRRLRPHSRRHRSGLPGLRRLQRAHSHARRVSLAAAAHRARVADGIGQRPSFSCFRGSGEDPQPDGVEALKLTTIRSHDQYNTTIYGLDDRYRGIFGRRDVLFMNEADLAALGIEHGDLVDVESVVDGTRTLKMERLTAVAHEIARGSVATYYPEANVLVPPSWRDERSGTPSYKCVPVRARRA